MSLPYWLAGKNKAQTNALNSIGHLAINNEQKAGAPLINKVSPHRPNLVISNYRPLTED